MRQSGEGQARGSGPGPARDWRQDAACLGMVDAFYDPWDSDDRAEQPSRTAAHICGMCPVRRACLAEAIRRDEAYGTWGGLTRVQRKKLARARKRKRCPICSDTLLSRLDDDTTQVCMSCGVAWKTIRTL